jgi:hypothetical protein
VEGVWGVKEVEEVVEEAIRAEELPDVIRVEGEGVLRIPSAV